MSDWAPHVTVATVVTRGEQFLLVEERDKNTGAMVFNQPAGHLEPGESLLAGALREVREETAWQVNITGVIGIALYTAPANGVTYHRTTFVADALAPLENAELDPDISAVHWLDFDEIVANSARMRSPLVIAAFEQYRHGHIYPLDFIYGS